MCIILLFLAILSSLGGCLLKLAGEGVTQQQAGGQGRAESERPPPHGDSLTRVTSHLLQ